MALAAGTVAAVGWWLFADTVRHHYPAAADPNTISFAHFGTYQDYQTWAQVIAAFERAHPGLHVRQEYVVGMYGAYNTKLRQQMLSRTLPHAFLVQLGPFANLADGFADLTELVGDPGDGLDLANFAPTSVHSFMHQGRIRGLPVSGGNLLIYCNPDCFARAAAHHGRDVPLPDNSWTTARFRELAEELTCDFDGDGQLDQFGFWQPRWVYYLPFLWSFGADVLDESGTTWLLTGSQAEEALRFYQNLRTGDRVSPRPDEVAQMFQDVGFLTGRTAMCVNGPWFQPFLAATSLADRYHVAHIPTGPAGRVTRITWDAVCMAPDLAPEQQANAWRFIRFVCSDQAQTILASTQRALPSLASASEHFTRADNGRRSGRFIEALAYSRTQPSTPFFREMDYAINRHLAALLREGDCVTPGQCLSELAADQRIAGHFRTGGVEP
jgi:multiple sugar transport system substrate-binding protein